MNPSAVKSHQLDIAAIRAAFPILDRKINGKALVFLDSAASSQKPLAVINAMDKYYRTHHANVHRGVYDLSQEATNLYESARQKVCDFINAADQKEIIYVRGTTEAMNLVAQSYGRTNLVAGDEVLITQMEHHSNIVPWQMVCQQTGATLKYVPLLQDGTLDQEAFQQLLSPKTKIFAVAHVSNALGTVNPLKEMIAQAHGVGAVVAVDGAQAVPHMKVDVRDLDADFYAFSAHKMYGPTGIGVLYGRKALLEAMPPWQGGGDMIRYVTLEKTEYNELPHKFEAGTPAIAEAVGLGATIDWLSELGMDQVDAHEQQLLEYGTKLLSDLEGVTIVGQAEHKAGVLSFVMDDAHPHDVGTILNFQGIAVRTGHHCAQPVMDFYDVAATARASLGVYNTTADLDALAAGLKKVKEVLG